MRDVDCEMNRQGIKSNQFTSRASLHADCISFPTRNHRILARGKQSGRNSKSLGRDGASGAATVSHKSSEDVMARNPEAMAAWSGAVISYFTAIRFRHLPASVQGTSKRYNHQPV